MMCRIKNAKSRFGQDGTAQSGFTLIELMVVITIILILASIAAGQYQKTVLRAKETKLKSELAVMRKAIQDYTTDKECGPSSLDDLVTNNYLRMIPADPITNASDQVSPFENTAYSSW